jgi:hypothetical protein
MPSFEARIARTSGRRIVSVTTGLDPVVHAEALRNRRFHTDCRIQPGGDEAAANYFEQHPAKSRSSGR